MTTTEQPPIPDERAFEAALGRRQAWLTPAIAAIEKQLQDLSEKKVRYERDLRHVNGLLRDDEAPEPGSC